MNRRITTMVAAALLLSAASAGQARAQWGYGAFGWGGWGGAGSIEGDVAQGMGVFAAGLGQFNKQTAVANSIDADTKMRLNEYIWQSEQIRRRQVAERAAARSARTREAIRQIQDRVLNNPDRSDIVSGSALNAILNELRNPKVPDSLLSNAGSDLALSGDQIRVIPLRFASKGVVISAHRLAAEGSWPASLAGPGFDELRKQYQALVEEVRNLPEETEVPDAKIVQAIGIVDQMRTLAQQRLQGPQFAEAERFLKAHAGLLQMARQPKIRRVLEAAYQKESVPLANALLGMDAFNLSFGKADGADEQELYLRTLYPMMAELRGRVAREMGGAIPGELPEEVGSQPPVGAFEKFSWDQLSRVDAPAEAPAPDEPEAPGEAK